MLKTVKDACEVFPTTLDYQVAGGVESLTQVLESEDGGKLFLRKAILLAGWRICCARVY